jgi:hypothetical protein
MSPQSERLVKVRVNASGRRLIGLVTLASDEYRISDRLNNGDPFLFLEAVESLDEGETGRRAILKDALSYVEALEEPDRPHSLREEGTFLRVTVELTKPAATLHGEVFIPAGKTIEDTLNDHRRFINLRDVSFTDSREEYGYLGLGKTQARLWAVQVA